MIHLLVKMIRKTALILCSLGYIIWEHDKKNAAVRYLTDSFSPGCLHNGIKKKGGKKETVLCDGSRIYKLGEEVALCLAILNSVAFVAANNFEVRPVIKPSSHLPTQKHNDIITPKINRAICNAYWLCSALCKLLKVTKALKTWIITLKHP